MMKSSLRALGAVVLAGTIACTNSTAPGIVHSMPVALNTALPTKLPVVDLSATPPGWVPVAYGDAQVSVPATWDVLFNVCVIGSSVGDVYLNPSGGFCTAQGPPKGRTNITLLPVTEGEFQGSPSSNGQRTVINGIAVYDLYLYGPAPPNYLIPSLGVQVVAEGPLARRVLDTLTRSPRVVALATGPIPSVPASWRTVTFGGVRVSVPSAWRIERESLYLLTCVSPQVTFGPPQVVLDTDARLSAPGCPIVTGPPLSPPSNGLRIDSGPFFPASTMRFTSTHCVSLYGLRVCPATSPGTPSSSSRSPCQGAPSRCTCPSGLPGTAWSPGRFCTACGLPPGLFCAATASDRRSLAIAKAQQFPY